MSPSAGRRICETCVEMFLPSPSSRISANAQSHNTENDLERRGQVGRGKREENQDQPILRRDNFPHKECGGVISR